MSNPTIHPELGPSTGIQTVRITEPSSGTIIFNRSSAPLPQGPRATIEEAIAAGDTMEQRQQKFTQCFPHFEQKAA